VDVLNQTVAELLGIHRTDLRCIEILARAHPVTASRLAELSGLTTGAMTSVLDRLERAGFARRVPDLADRRRVLVEPTAKAQEMGKEVYGDLVRQTHQFLLQFTDEELDVIHRYIQEGRDLTAGYAGQIQQRAAQIRAHLDQIE
jgi:DNA-binding MarR family transcriptional regulator